MAFTVFFAAYLVRRVSDMGGQGMEWLGCLMPNGWILRARAFGGAQWWVFLLVAAFVAALIGVAYRLSARRRDVGAGLVPPRLCPAHAPDRLRRPLGLAWRMQIAPPGPATCGNA
ncbi:hypothetical protein [Nonomuraea sp. NPDC049400]|uniref:hypothetical protein n=1 Tax=Nonomuraea sp. NPDC049400 TaxID=3364352 RepID=UPI00379DE088